MTTKIRILCRPSVWLEIDCNKPIEAMNAIALFQEFLSEEKCGRMDCGSTRIRFEHRIAQGEYHYYSLVCMECRAILDIHQKKEGGGVYFNRKLPSGEWDKNHNGWYMWKERQEQPRQEEQKVEGVKYESFNEPINTQSPGPNAPKAEDIPF